MKVRQLDFIFGAVIVLGIAGVIGFVVFRPVPLVKVTTLILDGSRYRQTRVRARGQILKDPRVRFVGAGPSATTSLRLFDPVDVPEKNKPANWDKGVVVELTLQAEKDSELPQRTPVEVEGTIESTRYGEPEIRIERFKPL